MNFDWEDFLKKEFPRGKIIKGSHGREYNIDCISEDCPHPEYHMFVNLGSDDAKHNRRFFCQRCGIRGNYKAFLINYYKLPYKTIVENITDLYGLEGDPFTTTKITAELLNSNLNLSYKTDTDTGFIVNLPKEFKKLQGKTKFCIDRDIPWSIIKKFRIGICKSGFYKNRLIFPIETNNNKSFLAYSQLPKKFISLYKTLSERFPDNKEFKKNKKKVLYPLGSLTSMLLFNYNNIEKNADILFVVEGALDCIRILLHGHQAVAKLGGYVSEYQAQSLSEKDPREICYMPDSDVEIKNVERDLSIIKNYCESPVSYIKLDSGDPDDIKNIYEFEDIITKRILLPNIANQCNYLKLL